MYKIFIVITLISSGLFSQLNNSSVNFSDYQISSEKYLTGPKGNIQMYVNVWGAVGRPGRILVYDGIDMATLFSLVGGPVSGANLKKVRLYREVPDDNSKLSYNVDFNDFIKTGNRLKFIAIKPNDTIIIPETTTSKLLSQIGTVNTFFSVITLYLTLEQRFTN